MVTWNRNRRLIVLLSTASVATPLLLNLWLGRGGGIVSRPVVPLIPLHPASSFYWLIPFLVRMPGQPRIRMHRAVIALFLVLAGAGIAAYLLVLVGMGWTISWAAFTILASTVSAFFELCVVRVREGRLPGAGMFLSAWLLQTITMSFGRGWIPAIVALGGAALLVFGSSWNQPSGSLSAEGPGR